MMNNFKNIVLFLLYSLLLLSLIVQTPNKIQYMQEHFYFIGFVGIIGFYRYSLWIVHLIRAQIYEKIVYANLKKKITQLPEKDWMPKRLYFLIVSYKENKKVLYNSIKSIIQESRKLNLPATICMGTASFHDEKIVSDAVNTLAQGHEIKVMFVRQNSPNKRLQIGRALRTLVKQQPQKNEPIIFMDGDSIIMPECLKKCLPVFHVQKNVHALTTNEKIIVKNSGLLANILNLRFAIRNFHMNSMSLSKKVLCLTGRFSIFRAGQIANEEFISRLEKDSINDWFWQKIHFLSGDDKSTWYSLLKKRAKMLYIPDAFVYSVETEHKKFFNSYIQKLKRWNGNMLRNNGRALALGPEKIGFFPWFILLDQRISMWTALVSPSIVFLSLFKDLQLTYMLIIWILSIKYLQTLFLFYYGRTINWSFPLIYYLNQILNGIVKIYMLFHLNIQNWDNRKVNQQKILPQKKFYFAFAKYKTAVSLALFLVLMNLLFFSEIL